MIRILDIKGNELYTISNDLPEIRNDSVPLQNGFYQMQVEGEECTPIKSSVKNSLF